MDADYPAAHSMDTSWFATDELGQVALFTTGENGPVPQGHSDPDLQWDLLESFSPGDEFVTQDVSAFGLFAYSHDHYDSPVHPYDREGVPSAPLHLDQLPPRFRNRCTLRLPIRFDQAARVQPVETLPCSYWYSGEVAYLCLDGVTVKPIAGQEPKFAAFVRELRERWPEQAAHYRFEGPTE